MKYAIITDGHTTNIIEADADFAASIGAIDAAGASIGDLWDGKAFNSPPPPPSPPAPIPQSVTMRQARLALLGAGLLDTVEAAIAGAGPAAKIEWEYAQEVQRSAGLVPEMATALGMTPAQIDALFVQAATL